MYPYSFSIIFILAKIKTEIQTYTENRKDNSSLSRCLQTCIQNTIQCSIPITRCEIYEFWTSGRAKMNPFLFSLCSELNSLMWNTGSGHFFLGISAQLSVGFLCLMFAMDVFTSFGFTISSTLLLLHAYPIAFLGGILNRE